MSGEHAALTAILAAVTTLLTAAGAFMVKSRLGDVLASPSGREETAVQRMASLLDKLANFQNEREIRLFSLQDKALDTVVQMTAVIERLSTSIQAHEASTGDRVQVLTGDHNEILICLRSVAAELAELRRSVESMAVGVNRERDAIEREKNGN